MKILLTILCLILLSSYSYSDDPPLDGLVESYYENGQTEHRGNYKNGKEDGLFEYYDADGSLREKMYYKNGKEDGLYEYYDADGSLREKMYYKNGKPDGLFEYYEKDGSLSYSKEIPPEPIEPIDTMEEKTAYDTLRDFLFVCEDELIEKEGRFYKKSSYTPYRGKAINCRKNRRYDFILTYRRGLRNGLYEAHYQNHQLRVRGNFQDGKPDGPFENYDEEGNLTKTREYKGGERDGPWQYYDKDGNLTKTEEYKDGKLIK